MQSLRDSGRLEDQRRTAPSPLPTATRTTPSPVVTHSGSVPQVDGRGFLACNLPWVETTRLRVTLCDVQPPVVRIIDVPADSVLPELHQLLQSAIGWTNSHLHQFMAGDVCYATATIESPEDIQDETSVPLTALGNTFEYLYDFGDGWEHIVEVLGAGGPEPGCRYGEGDCPPEDCGGPPGYAVLVEALADPSHPDHAELRSWVGERTRFDQAKVDSQVRDTAGLAPKSVRLILDLARDGVKVTPAGRLNRAFVREIQQRRPEWGFGTPASKETDVVSLFMLHHLLRDVGLLRLRAGTVTPIRAARDDREVVRRIRGYFSAEPFTETILTITVAELAVHGGSTPSTLAERAFEMLGFGWKARDGQPICVQDVRTRLLHLAPLTQALDLITLTGVDQWAPGPSALSLLPQAPGLAASLERE